MVILEIIGLPPQDREMLMEWSGAVVNSMGVAPTPAERRLGSEAGQSFAEYFRVKMQERREKPGQDLISKLIAVQAEDRNFSDDEIVANTVLLFVAGHETTVSLLGCGMLSLLRNPAELLKLRANPSLMGKAIEELLRYEAPIQFFGRMAKEDLSLGGKRIKKGQTVFIIVGAANRDPEQFPEPERLNIERIGNSHLTFGHGIHACIGQYLARVEGSIAFGALLEQFPKLRLAADPKWREALGGRSLTSLRLRFD
jgi:cytochrome P450